MKRGSFIAGDWGTSRLRLYLCDDDLSILDAYIGPGALAARGQHEKVLETQVAAWCGASGGVPIVLSGMVGSSIGWVETPYLACPSPPAALAERSVSLRNDYVHIVPGLRCRNRYDAPDVMRGEETQILGALQQKPELQTGRHLLCLPGTHTKWVLLSDGVITEFLTAPVGELFEILSRHSLLAADAGGAQMKESAFAAGLQRIQRFPDAELLHRIFECRGRRLSDELPAEDVGSFLSGMLIGSDVAGALRLFQADHDRKAVWLIGAPELARPYATALCAFGCAADTIDGDSASLAGLGQVHRSLSNRGAVRATG